MIGFKKIQRQIHILRALFSSVPKTHGMKNKNAQGGSDNHHHHFHGHHLICDTEEIYFHLYTTFQLLIIEVRPKIYEFRFRKRLAVIISLNEIAPFFQKIR